MRIPIIFILVLLRTTNCAKILGVFPIASVSHQVIFQPIWKELARKGHDVTVISPNVLNDSSLTNLKEIDIGFLYKIDKKVINELFLCKSVLRKSSLLLDFGIDVFEDVIKNGDVQNLVQNENEEFDVILLQTMHTFNFVFGFGARFKAPMIGISSMDLYLHTHDAAGNPTHPLVSPDIMLNFHGQLNFFDKVWSVLHNILYRMFYYWYALPIADKVARKYFGEDMPYLGDIEKNISLILTTVNPIIHPVRPNVPNVIEINQIHIREKRPLPKDLQDYLDSAPQGVVYFSLGSNVKSANISEKTRDVIIQALSELPYKVLWKWETDYLPGQPDNVLTRKWIPQQDVLGHPNIKAFVTQGGLQSIEEAICNEVPMVGLPFITDQPYNVRKLQDFGIAIGLDHKTMTKDQLKKAILEVAENKKYRERVQDAKAILTDQPMKGVEKAVWWIEYVIRHKGAKHLRSSAADMSFFEYFLVDVFAFLLLCVSIFIYTVVKVVALCIPKKKQPKMKNN